MGPLRACAHSCSPLPPRPRAAAPTWLREGRGGGELLRTPSAADGKRRGAAIVQHGRLHRQKGEGEAGSGEGGGSGGDTRGVSLLNAARWDGPNAKQPPPPRPPVPHGGLGWGLRVLGVGGGDTKKVGEERAEQAEGRQRCQHCDELCRPQLCGSAPPPPPPEPAASKGARAQLCRGRRGPWGLLFLPLPSPSASFPSCTVRVLERKKKKIQTKKEKRDPGSGGAVPVLTPTAPALGPPIPCRAPRWGGAGGGCASSGARPAVLHSSTHPPSPSRAVCVGGQRLWGAGGVGMWGGGAAPSPAPRHPRPTAGHGSARIAAQPPYAALRPSRCAHPRLSPCPRPQPALPPRVAPRPWVLSTAVPVAAEGSHATRTAPILRGAARVWPRSP